jgi:hypothetical protein
MPDFGPEPTPQELQFQHAEPIAEAAPEGSGPACVVCAQPAGDSYFQAQDQVVCAPCAERMQAGQQAVPKPSLIRAALYGGCAAVIGSALYAAVAIVLKVEIGIIAILVGWMVGKAIIHACRGRGGRPQQILAVLLTYFAITTSYIPVILYQAARNPHRVERTQAQAQAQEAPPKAAPKRTYFGAITLFLLLLAAAAPFLSLTSGVSAWISLFILFIGLQRAWKLTERREIVLTGPCQAETPQ